MGIYRKGVRSMKRPDPAVALWLLFLVSLALSILAAAFDPR